MKRWEKTGKKTVVVMDSIVNLVVLFILLLLLLFGGYALWDSGQIYKSAGADVYSMYKPTAENTLSFEDLQAANSDVFGWLTVYGTQIDYPLVQGGTNSKYLNTNVLGKYAISGSLFLDYSNSPDFSDFNSFIYGHHMEKNVMFAEIEYFADAAYFFGHRYGNLYYDGKDHGVEFFAFLAVDAYDMSVYDVAVPETRSQQYLDNLLEKAKNVREIDITTSDKIVLLSTCTSESTNGRHILVGRIDENLYQNEFEETIKKTDGGFKKGTLADSGFMALLKHSPMWLWILLIVLLLILALVVYDKVQKRRARYKQKRKMALSDECEKKS